MPFLSISLGHKQKPGIELYKFSTTITSTIDASYITVTTASPRLNQTERP